MALASPAADAWVERWQNLRCQVWPVMVSSGTNRTAFAVHLSLIIAVALSTVGLCLETIPAIQRRPDAILALNVLELVCVVMFTLEYAAKLATAPNRREFVLEVWSIVDLVSILPW